MTTASPPRTAFTYTHDETGNVNSNGKLDYLYDGDGRLCASRVTATQSSMTGYLYNAEGQRVAKGSLTSWSCDLSTNGFTVTNEYILGHAGEQVTELDGNGALIHTNVHADGTLVATYDPQGLHYHFNDWLGTRRLQTDTAGRTEQECTGGAFGDLLNCSGNDSTDLHFTGKERDTETNLDYFGARYYNSGIGRFVSPDWAAKAEPVPYAKLDNPQTLNLYATSGTILSDASMRMVIALGV